MDENEAELARLLYTRIGMAMEDASVIALELGGPQCKFDPAKVDELQHAVHVMAALIGAARVLNE